MAKSTFINFLKRTKRRTTRYYKIFKTPVIVFSIIIGLAIGYKLLPIIIISNMSPPAVTVDVEKATEEEWAEEIRSIGTIVAVQAVTISPEVGGTLVAIHFESGDKVTQGTKLVTLNDAAEQADLLRYKSQLDISKLTLDRSKKLSTRQVESRADYDQKKSKAEETAALVEQAIAIINKKNIRAPFNGTLGIRQVNLGDYLQPGTPIVTLTNSDKLYINFNLPERYSNTVKVGQKVLFKVDAFGDEEFEGIITTVDPQITAEARNMAIQASADNKDDKLKSGMFADIRIILPTESKAITVNETAIDYGLYGNSIYIVEKDQKDNLVARKKFIKTGIQHQGRIAITDGSIKAGDQVITAGQLKLNDGAIIKISTDKGLTPPTIIPKP